MLFIALSVIALGLSAISPNQVGFVRTSVMDGIAPSLSAIGMPVQKSAAFVRDISGLSDMQEENTRLTAENQKLRKWYHAAMALKAENESLQTLLNIKPQAEAKFVTARVLTDSGNRFVKSLVVQAGQVDGVQKGFAALSGDGVIGRVVETGQNTARILLVTDINSRVPILIEDTNQHGIMAGQNDVHPILEHFPPNSEVDDGARIVTSGDGGVFPPGLPVGRVFYEDEIFKVELYADFSRITHVQMIERIQKQNLNAEDLD